MKLTKLQLENFRSYPQYEHQFELNKGFTILVGPNGRGKTNFLEAIYLLSVGRSFRAKSQEDLIAWESEYLRCRGEIERDNEAEKLEVFLSVTPRKQKVLKHNEVSRRSSNYLGNLLTVLFTPEDLNVLYLSPSLRRRYLDTLLSQVNRDYLVALGQYQKVLKQRNSLLQTIREAKFTGADLSSHLETLDLWDEKLAEFGEVITRTRLDFIAYLNERLEEIYQSISGSNEEIRTEYVSKINHENFLADLRERHFKDQIQGRTTAGPHRDDLHFFIDGHNICESASRGEFRTLLLAIKLAEVRFMEEKTGEKPILLLDDVFSELDPERQNSLLGAIIGCQTIITTTDLANLGEILDQGVVIEV